MRSSLYNLSRVVETLAPALIGMPPGGGPWVERKFPAGDPVVEVVGGRATGKTALIRALYEGYHAFVPTACVDLAEAPYSAVDHGDRDRLDTANASPVTNLLFTVSHQLGYERDGSSRTVAFPRLSPALLVLTAWRPEAPDGEEVWPAQLVTAEEELRSLLAQPNPAPQARQDVIGRWLKALGGVAAGLLPGVPGLQEVLSAATESLLAREGDGGRWTWWRSRLDHLDGDAVQRLFALVRKFRRRGLDRAEVEAHLIAALLADINGAYGYWARKTQHPSLILLDNVDQALRERFLDPLVAQYAQATGEWSGRGRVMLPIVFATSLGNGSDPGLAPTTDAAHWTVPERCPPRSWLLRLGVPRVTDGEIRAMLGDTACPPALPTVIGRLSGGRTGDALLLARAARRRLGEPEPFVLDRLLSLPSPDSPSRVGARLLERSLPDDAVREEVIRVAPALDSKAAERLLRAAPSVLPGETPDLRVRGLLDSTLKRPHWNHRPWPPERYEDTPLVTDRALRALLLHELRAGADEGRWSGIHAALAAHYNAGDVRLYDSEQHEPRYLHHALAQGRIDTLVVRAMHHRYLRRTPAEWLSDLNLAAAAPPAWAGFAPEDPPHPAGLPACSSCGTDADKRVHAAIRRLLATVWRLSAPLSAVPPGHRDTDMVHVRTTLEVLCADYGNSPRPQRAYNAYVDAIADGGWIDALVNGVQAPDLPVDGR